jgi:hypothetical protein
MVIRDFRTISVEIGAGSRFFGRNLRLVGYFLLVIEGAHAAILDHWTLLAAFPHEFDQPRATGSDRRGHRSWSGLGLSA